MSISSHSDRTENNWTSSWSDDHRSTSIHVRGEVQWNDEATDVASISKGGSFDLTIDDGAHHRHAEILPSRGGLTRTLLVDGEPRPWDAEWFARALQEMDQHTAFAADLRFPKLYRQGGARAVLDYVGRVEGDYARRRYLQLLVERDPLDEVTALAIFRITAKMGGDYDRAEVLKAVAAKARLDTEGKRKAFLAACADIHGDYERGRVLHELTSQPRLSPELTRLVLEAGSKISGDYEKAQVLIALAEHHPVAPADYLAAAGRLSGDYEHARALKALISTQRLDSDGQITLIRQATRLGDYESAEVLVALTRSTRLAPDAQREYQSAADHLGDYSRKRVLAALSR
ncbi:MAG TPA: hypothetical protein VFE90_00190 [Myxococcales bacterium]|nr:hypothetical protein [Myxococcales bacterium]